MKQPLDEMQLETSLQELRRKKKLSLPFFIAAGVLFILFFLLESMIVFILSIGSLIAGIAIYSIQSSAIKDLISTTLVPSVLGEIFQNVRYDHDGHIPDHIIRSTDMDFPFSYDKIKGSDYIQATYKGLNIQLSDIRLIDVRTHVSSKGHVRREEHTVFKGMWMICDFGKELSADLTVRERAIKGFKLFRGKNDVQTENEAFNDKFVIRSSSDHDAFYVLTPHMMEYILSMDTKGKGDTYLRFERYGSVHIVINSGRDSFEISSSKDLGQFRKQFYDEIRYITDLIDELRLAETL